jgi:hypothetical protein
MAFHSDGKYAHVLDELASSVTVFDYDGTRAAFIWQQTISTLPPNFTGTNTTAEVRIHPNGRFRIPTTLPCSGYSRAAAGSTSSGSSTRRPRSMSSLTGSLEPG